MTSKNEDCPFCGAPTLPTGLCEDDCDGSRAFRNPLPPKKKNKAGAKHPWRRRQAPIR